MGSRCGGNGSGICGSEKKKKVGKKTRSELATSDDPQLRLLQESKTNELVYLFVAYVALCAYCIYYIFSS